MAQTVWIARHGNRQDFVDPLWRGTAVRPNDPGLSEDGIIQAQRLGRRMAEEGIGRIFASPFLRTVQTAHYVAEAAGAPLHIEPSLCEWLNAEWFELMPEIVTPDEVREHFPHVDTEYTSYGIPAFPEAIEDAFRRSGEAARHIVERYPEDILLVGHGVSVYGAARGLIQDLAYFDVALCSVAKLVKHGTEWVAELCGDISHLDEAVGADRYV